MGKVLTHMTTSLDGYIADPDDQPGELFDWYEVGEVPVPSGNETVTFDVDEASAAILGDLTEKAGALVSGRRLFDIANGWNDSRPALPGCLMTEADMLRITDLEVRYRGVVAVRSASLSVPAGACVSIIGANGAGKTSIIRAISGLVSVSKDTHISLDDKRIDGNPAHRRARIGVGHVLQNRHVFPSLSVRENLLLGGNSARGRGDLADRLDRVTKVFPEIEELYNRLGSSLSGGQQQFLAIGRAMMAEPKVLLLDEPSAGLSPALVVRLAQAIEALRDAGTTIVLVEQILELVERVSSEVYILSHGLIVERVGGADPQLKDLAHEWYLR